MKTTTKLLLTSILLSGCVANRSNKHKQTFADALTGFIHPQDSARTKVWWFHGETETTKEGITADLEAFKRAGVGGVVYYDQNHGKGENALQGLSPEWWQMLRFAATEAKRLGLTFEIHISNGYVAGGPWITNETGMKRLIAKNTTIRGGHIDQVLPAPASGFYKDVAVLAFPSPAGAGITSSSAKPVITADISNAAKLFEPASGALPKIARRDEGIYINLEFKAAFEARSISYEAQPRGKATTSATNVPGPPSEQFTGTGYRILPDIGQLEVSDDGVRYRRVCDIKPIYRAHEKWRQKTIAFPAVKAKHYRLHFHDWWENSEQNHDLMIGAIVLSETAKVDQWEEKAGLFTEYIEADQTPSYPVSAAIDAKKVINISNKMDANGRLTWDAPAGDWTILRFAYVPTGATIKHGRANLMGRECDKLSVQAAELQWNNYVARIADTLGNRLLSGVAMDSHEAGSQNWTDDFIETFKTKRGYDPVAFLPAMAGYVVDSAKASAAFLFDVRRNIADMISDNYYGTFERLAQARGLVFTAQAIGNALCIVGDPIQAKSKVSKPQGEFWAIHPDGNYDIKESSSAAHLYGKKIASGEAYTDAKYSASPAELKSLADYAYAFGINEFVICASAYQPWLDKTPGSTGGGRHYAINRNNTWWDYSRPFWDFQARNAYILRQGKSSAALCIYLGENAPVKILTYRLPEIPGGYDFDAFTTDALLTRMHTRDHAITLPDGVQYQLMVLPRNGDITLDALRKIAAMVKKGARIYGPKPVQSGTGNAAEYKAITDQLWNNQPEGMKQVGNGQVYWGMPLDKALSQAGIQADVAMQRSDTKKAGIYFNHRTLADADLYFLHNHKATPEADTFTFAAKGKHAQLWNTVTGKRYHIPLQQVSKGFAKASLSFAPGESFFMLITDKEEQLPALATNNQQTLINGPWNVYFKGQGKVTFDTLTDWTTHPNPAIKHYSGTAIYQKTITFDAGNKNVDIDLGNPGFVAQVLVNGEDAGIVWCSPWRLDITRLLKKGDNTLEIRVANSLMNRMIYDAGLPEAERLTYAYPAIVKPGDALVPSGLRQVKLISY